MTQEPGGPEMVFVLGLMLGSLVFCALLAVVILRSGGSRAGVPEDEASSQDGAS